MVKKFSVCQELELPLQYFNKNRDTFILESLSTMKNYLLVILAVITATSCTKYSIAGSSDIQDVDGRMLYLRSFTDDVMNTIDSCDVVHGKFKFSGALDSVRVVMLGFDDLAVIPVVLEDGNIEVTLNSQRQECKGTPLNDTLSSFTSKYSQIVLQMEDLEHQQNQAIMNGEDMDVVNQRLATRQQQLLAQEDKLVNDFIAANFDNCLGPYVFQMATQNYQYPVLAPWIEALMTKATDTFKNAPYVKDYMEAAQHNQDVMTGVADIQPQLPQQPLPNTPTPNELAK